MNLQYTPILPSFYLGTLIGYPESHIKRTNERGGTMVQLCQYVPAETNQFVSAREGRRRTISEV